MRGAPPEIGGQNDGAAEFPVFERTRPWRELGAKLIPELNGREISAFRSFWGRANWSVSRRTGLLEPTSTECSARSLMPTQYRDGQSGPDGGVGGRRSLS
jgi:hypothetical protein